MQILNYYRGNQDKCPSKWRYLLWFVAMTPVAITLVVVAGAGGHGSYIPFKLLFPYTMLSFRLHGEVTFPYIMFGLIQFPFYGFVISFVIQHAKHKRITLVVLSLLHLAAVGSVITVAV